MRVVCVQLTNPNTGLTESTSPWLDLDTEYEVLEVYAYPGGRIDLRIAAKDAGTPALFDSELFMTVDERIPPNWIARVREGGTVEFGPSTWLETGFWERFFDRDSAAIESFETEKRRMLDRDR